MKRMYLLGIALFAITFSALAQPGGGPPRRTVEERVAAIHAKMDSAFKLDAATAARVDSVFTDYYKAADKIREELFASGERPSREAVQEKMQPITEAREERLKKVLPEAQYEIWKKQVEPSMRPQRQGGGN